MKKHTLQYVQDFVAKKGGKCLDMKYINIRTKMWWQCKDGHEWKSVGYAVLNKNQWCPKCAINIIKQKSTKHSMEEANKIAIKRNGLCLSKNYINNTTQMRWQCEYGHKWNATFAGVLKGDWCRWCKIDKSRLTILDAKKMAEKNGGFCLSNVYTNNHTKLDWECRQGHRWPSTYNCVQANNWCAKCNNSKMQNKIAKIIEVLFPHCTVKQNYKEFEWLKTDKIRGRQELDIYIPELKLAIEYDGEHHFEPVRFGNISKKQANIKYKRQKKLDKIKNKKIEQHPEDITHFIRFNCKELIGKEYVIDKILNSGITLK